MVTCAHFFFGIHRGEISHHHHSEIIIFLFCRNGFPPSNSDINFVKVLVINITFSEPLFKIVEIDESGLKFSSIMIIYVLVLLICKVELSPNPDHSFPHISQMSDVTLLSFSFIAKLPVVRTA